jgi:serine/threonine protein kinase
MQQGANRPKQAASEKLDELLVRYLERMRCDGKRPDVEEFLAESPGLRERFLQRLASHWRDQTEPMVTPVGPPTAAPTTNSLESGQIIGDCRILKELGRGGMGVVYLGQHVRVLDVRAIKVLPRGMGTDHAIKRFQREAQTAASINHVNVVRIHDVGKSGEWHFIVMQYVDGQTLDQLIRQRGPLPWSAALELLVPLLDALTAIHRQELIHRDIKPSNVMVSGVSGGSAGNHVVLMDFGLVHDSQDDGFTEAGAVLGTPAYMAPEQARGQKVDHRADLYAVGATLYYLLAGEPPFQGNRLSVFCQVANGTPAPDLAVLRPELPVRVREFVRTAMHPSVDARYASAEAMLRAARSLLLESQGEAAPHSPPFASPVFRDSPAISTLPPVQTPGILGNSLDRASGDSSPRHHDDTKIAERMREAREKLAAAEVTGRFQWSNGKLPTWTVGAWALAGVFLVAVAIAILGRHFASKPEKAAPQPQVQQASRTAGMVYVPPGPVQLGATAERLRAHALTLDALKDNPQLVEQFVEVCLEEKLQIVNLPGYWIDKYEVTNAEYQRFVEATNHRPPPYWTSNRPPPGLEQHPVVQVSYDDAVAYAAWAGKQLPTIAQWTRAFRGSDDRMYPWGERWESGRVNDVTNIAFDSGTSSVTATPRDVSSLGVYNMVGNVDEVMREQTIDGGRTHMITKGAHSMCRGAVYGAAPFQFICPADDVSNEHTGFRCVIEDTTPP